MSSGRPLPRWRSPILCQAGDVLSFVQLSSGARMWTQGCLTFSLCVTQDTILELWGLAQARPCTSAARVQAVFPCVRSPHAKRHQAEEGLLEDDGSEPSRGPGDPAPWRLGEAWTTQDGEFWVSSYGPGGPVLRQLHSFSKPRAAF